MPPSSSEPTIRSMVPTQPEFGNQGNLIISEVSSSQGDQPTVVWTRLPGQSCKIPNTRSIELESGARGCSALSFSADGRRLAVGVAGQTTSTIRVYDIPSGILVIQLEQLYGLVYEISFHEDGLMTAAVGDGRVSVWNTDTWELIHKLDHPSYIYSAGFYPKNSDIIATAGFDRVVRLWKKEGRRGKDKTYSVVQELSGHNSHINCIVFDAEGHFLFSGDKQGTIKMWESLDNQNQIGFESSTDSYARPNTFREWRYKREYKVEDQVCKLSLHPGGRRLLVHRLNPTSPLVMLDLRNGSFMQTYPDIQTFRVPAASCITPCGSWVIGGSNSGYSVVWNTDTGEKQHVYKDLPYTGPISAVQYHPFDHFLVIGSSEPNSKVCLYTFDKKKDIINDEKSHEVGTPRVQDTPKYPFKQVAKIILDGSAAREEMKTPVDLQDIVEKLNLALQQCRAKKEHSSDLE
ncbi:jouberin [Eurytemora carolleeae]|uniref:jouberin n=1 Tax=Eurytemora carolleeae TaxID=1294199 RepID=UPI000C76594E|nr:jouberin [Eurytemora carolleeae]|eukprot:XP_023336515.1 jouberin-like [Eurytemora affinis]